MPTPSEPSSSADGTIKHTGELQNLKKEFLASVSHELRTPLSVIMGYVQILKEETLGPLTAEQKKSLDTIFGRAEDLLRVMTNLLAARDVQEGKKNLKMEPLDLRVLVTEHLGKPIREKTRKRMSLEQNLSESEIWVRADAQKIGEVVDNLLLNAFKFGPEGSAVRVEVASDGKNANVLVADGGPGLSDAARRTLFEPFSATERGLTRDYGGLGLSLFLCKEILSQHGGSISMDGQNGAAGCLVRLALPLCPKPMIAGSNAGGAPKRILIVEDDMDFLQLLVIFLGRLGDTVEVVAVESGADALKEAALRTPDLVILDLMLPGLNGLSILERLKNDRKTAKVPILIVSGHEAGVRKAQQAGAQDALVKPFDEALFISKVSVLLGKTVAAKRP